MGPFLACIIYFHHDAVIIQVAYEEQELRGLKNSVLSF